MRISAAIPITKQTFLTLNFLFCLKQARFSAILGVQLLSNIGLLAHERLEIEPRIEGGEVKICIDI